MVAVLAIVLTTVVTAVSGQQALSSHALVGSVTDASGAGLPGVSVELSNPASANSIRTVVTARDGRYRIDRVVPGVYVLTFRLLGFSPVIRDIEIGSGTEDFEFDVEMRALPSRATLMKPPGPSGPQRRVVCGMTLITPPNVDPGIVAPVAPPLLSIQPVKPTMRTVQPTMCWDPAPLAPATPAR